MPRASGSSRSISRWRPKARSLRYDSRIVMPMPAPIAEMKKRSGSSGVYQSGCSLLGHDQVERAERRLVQGREDHAERSPAAWRCAWMIRRGRSRPKRSKTTGENSSASTVGVEHHAPGHLEHHRVRVPEDQRVPDAPRLPEVEEQPDDDQQVAEEAGEHGRADDRARSACRLKMCTMAVSVKAAGRQADAAQDVEADPEAPGELVAQVGDGAQAAREAQHGHRQRRGAG